MNKKPGYILLLTLMLTGMSVLLISTVIYKASVLSRYAAVFLQREKAKALARSGVEIALSQLSSLLPEEEDQEKENKQNADENGKAEKGEKKDPRKKMFAELFSIINRWQTVKLQEETFNVEGEISIYIASEKGKINIGQLYDFKKDEFVKIGGVEGKKIAESLFKSLGEQIKQEKLLSSFEQFMKERSYPLQDVSELLLAKNFKEFKQYLFPPKEEGPADPKEKGKKKAVYLMDLFTIEADPDQLDPPLIDPLLLSESVSALFGFNRQSTKDGQKWAKELPESPHKGGYANDWEGGGWDKILAPLYKKEYNAIPADLKKLFSNLSSPTLFSVLVYASVGKITQKMYAIVHKDSTSNNFKLRKIYWL